MVAGGNVFVLTEMNIQQAEEMAKNIKALMDGRLDWNCWNVLNKALGTIIFKICITSISLIDRYNVY